MRLATSVLGVLALSGGLARGQVFSSEFFSDPVSEGWDLLQEGCGPDTWNEDGWYHQAMDFEACGFPDGGQEDFVLAIDAFNGVPRWFYELRVETNGDQSEIDGAAPGAIAAGNSFGELYRLVIARDLVMVARDVDLPIFFIELEPRVPHRFRVDLSNEGTPTYRWFIDGVLIDEGVAEDVFPSDNSRITWRGKAWHLPCENAWDYIRFGVPGAAHSNVSILLHVLYNPLSTLTRIN